MGVYFEEYKDFSDNIINMSQYNMKILGFMYRKCQELSLEVTKTLYTSLVWSNIEYTSIVWSPHYQNYTDIIETVQNKILWIAASRLKIDFDNYHRHEMLRELNLMILERLRQFLVVYFLYSFEEFLRLQWSAISYWN